MEVVTSASEAIHFIYEHQFPLNHRTATIKLNHEMQVEMTVKGGTVKFSMPNAKTIECSDYLSARRVIFRMFREFWFAPSNIQNRWNTFVVKGM